jgi:hypothetical protein
MDNPFAVKSAETQSPAEIASLFVDVFSDFPKVREVGHTFVHGARGTGKSMMLRFLEPQAQIASKNVSGVADLRFFAVHVPIRKVDIPAQELEKLDETARIILGEHLLTLHCAVELLRATDGLAPKCEDKRGVEFLAEVFSPLFSGIGGESVLFHPSAVGEQTSWTRMRLTVEREVSRTIQYLKRQFLRDKRENYEYALASLFDFLLPLADAVRTLEYTPSGPLFLMIDDADLLRFTLQRVLNSWVARRVQDRISFKITTQQKYLTWRTTDGSLISSPHDFTEVDINTIYTTAKDRYFQRLEKIVERRLLHVYGEGAPTPQVFFPPNKSQDKRIAELKKRLVEAHRAGLGRGHRPSDDATRFAVPIYMTELAGKRKASATFSYAGFRSIVDVSSGIIRWFLEPASIMFGEVLSGMEGENKAVLVIPHNIQDRVVKDWSEGFLEKEFSTLGKTEDTEPTVFGGTGGESSVAKSLRNLLDALGELFRRRLLDPNAAERRVFSVVLTGDPPPELQAVLDLGVQHGFLQRSMAGNKLGTGRSPQYILSRRLAPHFKLDPSGFAGNLSVAPKDLFLACSDPKMFVQKRLARAGESAQKSAQSELNLGN